MYAQRLTAIIGTVLGIVIGALPIAVLADEDDGSAAYASAPASAIAASVVGLIDGDTIQVSIDGVSDAVTLLGSDAPESFLADGTVPCGGPEAAARLAALLPIGTNILLDAGSDAEERDESGALLRYVWLDDTERAEAVLVDKQMLVDGYAMWDGTAGTDRAADLGSASTDAKARRVGLWRTCGDLAGEPEAEAVTAPTPSIEQIAASYPVLADVRELAIRPGSMLDDKVAFSGTILTIKVAAPEMAFYLGDTNTSEYEVQMQVTVPAPDGTTQVIFVGYSGDTAGMFEGSWVTVYGTVVGTQSFQNAMGGGITQPLVSAELVLLG